MKDIDRALREALAAWSRTSAPAECGREPHSSRAELQTESKPGGPALPAEGARSSRGPQRPRCSAPADGSKQRGLGEPLTYRSRLLLPGQSRGGSRGTFTETLDPQRGRSAGPGPGGGRHVAEGWAAAGRSGGPGASA